MAADGAMRNVLELATANGISNVGKLASLTSYIYVQPPITGMAANEGTRRKLANPTRRRRRRRPLYLVSSRQYLVVSELLRQIIYKKNESAILVQGSHIVESCSFTHRSLQPTAGLRVRLLSNGSSCAANRTRSSTSGRAIFEQCPWINLGLQILGGDWSCF
ncbi:hypothetical protein HPP92_028292 [Vanilla planifolia]|uniref:Uncharacterized protein n=1 Tax=Vanilla planifolia TaxID=51239 RepID=A0A835U3J3_VANPL|nr:hypothetical protein HPP92_028292 [Vanilla planifolia]